MDFHGLEIESLPPGVSGIGDGAVTLPIQLPKELSDALQAGPASSLLKLAGIRYLSLPSAVPFLPYSFPSGIADLSIQRL